MESYLDPNRWPSKQGSRQGMETSKGVHEPKAKKVDLPEVYSWSETRLKYIQTVGATMSSGSGARTDFHIYQDVYTDRNTIRAFARDWCTRLQHSDGRNTLRPPLPTHERPFLRKIERWRTHIRTRIWYVYAEETSIKIACDKTDELPGARLPIGWRLAIDVTRGWGYGSRDVRRVRACVRMTP